MARPTQEAIDTFMGITDSSEDVAIQRLEGHNGDLNRAINAHFSEGDRNSVQAAPAAAAADDDDHHMEIDDVPEIAGRRPQFSNARGLTPSSLSDPDFTNHVFDRSSLFDTTSEIRHRSPALSHLRGDTVTTDDDDDDDSLSEHRSYSRPSAAASGSIPDDHHDIEEEMIKAAIEASKKDAEPETHHESNNFRPQEREVHLEEDEFSHAVSMSFKTERERALRAQGVVVGESGPSSSRPIDRDEFGMLRDLSARKRGSSSAQDVNEELEQPLLGDRSKHISSSSTNPHREPVGSEGDFPLNDSDDAVADQPQINGNAFQSDEWGGISSLEHDEAVMLEAAMFGGVEQGGYNLPFAQQLNRPWHAPPRPPSPGLAAQRLIREQQDDEYLAALEADRQKEMKALEEEIAAREAAQAEARRKEEEARRKLEEEQELERLLAAKEASLPEEPVSDDENAVALVVRMPDGGRRGRRFLRSDKIQCLYDYIDVGRAVKPGSYRVVRAYPRRAFGEGESSSTLNELGLTSKQEALYLEPI